MSRVNLWFSGRIRHHRNFGDTLLFRLARGSLLIMALSVFAANIARGQDPCEAESANAMTACFDTFCDMTNAAYSTFFCSSNAAWGEMAATKASDQYTDWLAKAQAADIYDSAYYSAIANNYYEEDNRTFDYIDFIEVMGYESEPRNI